MLVFALF